MRRPPLLAAVSIAVLLALALTAFAATRALRARDDVVNTVVLSERLPAEGRARISFVLARADERADVLIVDEAGRPVRTLDRDAELEAAEHRYRWNGSDDAGDPAPPGEYRLRVVLGEQDRRIDAPFTILVPERPG